MFFGFREKMLLLIVQQKKCGCLSVKVYQYGGEEAAAAARLNELHGFSSEPVKKTKEIN